jgi:hypothetical protein
MDRIKVSANFYADEFLHPGETDITKIDSRLIDIAQHIRTTTGKSVTINNYATGGQYKESGLRSATTSTGAKKSAHKEGMAIDVKIAGMNGEQMYQWAKQHQKELYALGVRQIEHYSLTATWLHLATRGQEGMIQVIDLSKVVEVWKQ